MENRSSSQGAFLATGLSVEIHMHLGLPFLGQGDGGRYETGLAWSNIYSWQQKLH